MMEQQLVMQMNLCSININGDTIVDKNVHAYFKARDLEEKI